DCIILRVEVLVAAGNGDEVVFSLETRGEDGTSAATIVPTEPSGGLELNSTGVATCLYLATTSTSPGNGSQEQVRVQVSVPVESGPGYYVVRIFPFIFFDSSKPIAP
ncbi:MAG: hypothetical protein Q8M65_09810, partial [Rhodoglobus sp.]|nr:hypothetical protein [Rhodoglobus sp.]